MARRRIVDAIYAFSIPWHTRAWHGPRIYGDFAQLLPTGWASRFLGYNERFTQPERFEFSKALLRQRSVSGIFANMASRHRNGPKTTCKFGCKLFSSTCEEKNAKSLFSESDSLTLGFVWQVQSTSHYQSLATIAQFLCRWLCFKILRRCMACCFIQMWPQVYMIKISHPRQSQLHSSPLVGRVATNSLFSGPHVSKTC